MWYVMQVFTGREEKTAELCRKQIDAGLLEECFVPYYEQSKKYLGKWHKEKKILFPGYVFIITDRINDVFAELKKVQAFTKVLGDKECLIPLTDSETSLLKRFGGKDHFVEMSVGFIENDIVKITDGPLIGMEGCIKKINRHKRQAQIQIEMFGQTINSTVGLEIIKKI